MGLFNTDRSLIKAFRNEFVTRATSDPYGNLWVGTRYNGMAFFNKATKDKRYFNSHTSAALASFSHDFVQEMAFDSDGRLWAGYNNSLIVCRPDYNNTTPTGQLTVIKKFPSFVNVVSIAEDTKGQMWVGTDNIGLFIFDRDLNIVKTISTPLIRSNNITKIIPYDENHILISAYTDNLYLVDIEKMTIRNFEPSNQKAWNSAIDMMLDRDNNLWVGTYHNGLLRFDAKTREITSCLGNQTYDIVGLSQDSNGDIWASSSYGIYRFDSSGKQINSYLKPDGLGGNQFHEKCVASMPGGKILFGGNAGLEEIDPNTDAKFTPPNIPLTIKGLWLLPDYRPALNEDMDNLAEASVDELTLNHNDNSINIEYFALCYDGAADIQYAYMLKGLDKDFINIGNYNRVSYSDLPAGDFSA